MAELNLKALDESLLRAVKIAAIDQGLSMRDFVIKALTAAIGWEKPLKVVQPTEIPKNFKKVASESISQLKPRVRENTGKSDVVVEKTAKLCPRCEKPTIPWGSQVHCTNCNQNWPAEVEPALNWEEIYKKVASSQ